MKLNKMIKLIVYFTKNQKKKSHKIKILKMNNLKAVKEIKINNNKYYR